VTTGLFYEMTGRVSTSGRSEVVHVLLHVSEDGVMGLDGSSVGGSLVVHGLSVHVVGVSQLGEGNLSTVSGNSSAVSHDAVDARLVGVDGGGTSEKSPGVSLDLTGTDAHVVGAAVGSESFVSSDHVDSHFVDFVVDNFSLAVELAVPVSVAMKRSLLVFLGSGQSFPGEVVVVAGSHLGGEGFLHLLEGELVGSDGLLVSSDFPSVSSVKSEEESLGGSSSVPGVEVVVGFDVSGSDEGHVLAEVSHASGHGGLEGTHAVEERGVAERTSGSLGLSGGTVIPVLTALAGAVGDRGVAASLVAVEALLAVGVAVAISFTSAESVLSLSVDLVTVEFVGGVVVVSVLGGSGNSDE